MVAQPRPVAFIGLGQIGAPMAKCLQQWPGGLVVCDLRPEATAPFEAEGAAVAATPAEVASTGAEVISVMVLDDDQVRDVVGAIVPAAAPDTVIAIHSTIRPETAEELAAGAAERGVEVIDAPVSGGFMGAHEGNLAIMVGGTEEAFDRAYPALECFGGLIQRFGPAGAGTRAKLARNLLTFAAYAVAGEAQALAEASGIDLRKLAKVVRHSDAITGGPGAILLRDTTAPLPADDPLRPILEHTRGLGEKDLALALELASSLGVDLPLTRTALDRFAPGLGVPHDDA